MERESSAARALRVPAETEGRRARSPAAPVSSDLGQDRAEVLDGLRVLGLDQFVHQGVGRFLIFVQGVENGGGLGGDDGLGQPCGPGRRPWEDELGQGGDHAGVDLFLKPADNGHEDQLLGFGQSVHKADDALHGADAAQGFVHRVADVLVIGQSLVQGGHQSVGAGPVADESEHVGCQNLAVGVALFERVQEQGDALRSDADQCVGDDASGRGILVVQLFSPESRWSRRNGIPRGCPRPSMW